MNVCKTSMPGASFSNPAREAWERIRSEWPLKLALTILLNAFFWTAYSFLSRQPLFPVRSIPLTWLDSAVAFEPTVWGWIYLSEFLATGSVPWLISTRADLRRYVIGLSALCGGSFLCFLFFPVAAPRPSSVALTGAGAFIAAWDGPFNAFPSLHAGFLVYTFALAWRLFGRRAPTAACLGAAVWGGLILYATLATKQHYALDLLGGGVLGWAADWLAWNKPLSGWIATASIFRNRARASQAGCR
jgi:membrane-associated phospholipid phosphatase